MEKKKNVLARRPKALQAGGSTRVPRKVATQATLPVGWVRETEWRFNRFFDVIELAVVKLAGSWKPMLNNQRLVRASGFTSPFVAMRACERRAKVILEGALRELSVSALNAKLKSAAQKKKPVSVPKPSGNAGATPKRKTKGRRAK